MEYLSKGVTLRYEMVGNGEPVLLIHGFPLCRLMWKPQAEALALNGFRAILPDLRGFGESGPGDGKCSMETYADDMVTLLDHLGIERAVVGGMSMGGYVLLNLLERYPERVSAACFIVTRAGADDEGGKARRKALAEEVLEGNPGVVAEGFGKILFAEETMREKTELVEVVGRWMDSASTKGLANGLLAMGDRKDYASSLHTLNLPALIVGAAEDKAIPVEHARILERGIKGSVFRIIEGAGHMVNLERPEEFNDALISFLKGLRA